MDLHFALRIARPARTGRTEALWGFRSANPVPVTGRTEIRWGFRTTDSGSVTGRTEARWGFRLTNPGPVATWGRQPDGSRSNRRWVQCTDMGSAAGITGNFPGISRGMAPTVVGLSGGRVRNRACRYHPLRVAGIPIAKMRLVAASPMPVPQTDRTRPLGIGPGLWQGLIGEKRGRLFSRTFPVPIPRVPSGLTEAHPGAWSGVYTWVNSTYTKGALTSVCASVRTL